MRIRSLTCNHVKSIRAAAALRILQERSATHENISLFFFVRILCCHRCRCAVDRISLCLALYRLPPIVTVSVLSGGAAHNRMHPCIILFSHLSHKQIHCIVISVLSLSVITVRTESINNNPAFKMYPTIGRTYRYECCCVDQAAVHTADHCLAIHACAHFSCVSICPYFISSMCVCVSAAPILRC